VAEEAKEKPTDEVMEDNAEKKNEFVVERAAENNPQPNSIPDGGRSNPRFEPSPHDRVTWIGMPLLNRETENNQDDEDGPHVGLHNIIVFCELVLLF